MVLGYLDRQHSRSESYRAARYAAQLQATSDVLRAAGEFHHAALTLTHGHDFGGEAGNRLSRAVDAVDVARSAGLGVLPDAISNAAIADIKAVFDAVFLSASPELTAQQRRDRINEAWVTLVSAVHHALGAKDLDKQIRRLTGVTAREQLQNAAELYRERLEDSGGPLMGRGRRDPEPPVSDQSAPTGRVASGRWQRRASDRGRPRARRGRRDRLASRPSEYGRRAVGPARRPVGRCRAADGARVTAMCLTIRLEPTDMADDPLRELASSGHDRKRASRRARSRIRSASSSPCSCRRGPRTVIRLRRTSS